MRERALIGNPRRNRFALPEQVALHRPPAVLHRRIQAPQSSQFTDGFPALAGSEQKAGHLLAKTNVPRVAGKAVPKHLDRGLGPAGPVPQFRTAHELIGGRIVTGTRDGLRAGFGGLENISLGGKDLRLEKPTLGIPGLPDEEVFEGLQGLCVPSNLLKNSRPRKQYRRSYSNLDALRICHGFLKITVKAVKLREPKKHVRISGVFSMRLQESLDGLVQAPMGRTIPGSGQKTGQDQAGHNKTPRRETSRVRRDLHGPLTPALSPGWRGWFPDARTVACPCLLVREGDSLSPWGRGPG